MATTGGGHDDAHLLGEWARLLFGTLCTAGVSDVFISPGSRSTPFAWAALQTRGLRCHPIIDERSAAFAALGYARATGRPGALLCTSGSAPAHYFPAIVEAAQAFLPLLVITADRPFEAQHSGASQSIDQLKLFGDHARRYFELGLPDAARSALFGLRRAVCQAVAISRGSLPGPVHLNARARKPLEPRAPVGNEQSALSARISALLAAPLTHHVQSVATPVPQRMRELAQALAQARSGAIVLGPLPPQRIDMAGSLADLATALGFPILAEASSQMRFTLSDHPLACPDFSWLLCSERLRRSHAPDLLLYVGAPPTCSELESWALESEASRYVIAEYESRDPLGDARLIVRGDPGSSLRTICGELASMAHRPHRAQRAFAHALLESSRACAALISEELACEPALAEGSAVASIARALPDGAQWVLGNSLPIRDVDAYVSAAADVVILSQRGANGIDGLVAGAAGSALATKLPTLVLMGDVSLLHDIGSLAVARLLRTPLVLAVIDNDGGRIFDQLPVQDLYATAADLAGFWRTPPGCDFEHAAHLFGLHYAAPTTETELVTATQDAMQRCSATLLHVRVACDSARTVRERVLARLAASVAEAAA
jgi:2-succinyl-5-enolpyruvyl-6-hydroxy-3-cyclohexene-1-carboxylate synthase